MYLTYARGGCAALTYFVASQAALADLSAQDVWSDWRAYLSGTGYEINATEQMSGDTLTISDFSMAMAMEDQAGSVTITVGQIEFKENNDGTVGVVLPAQMPMTIEGEDDGDDFAAVVTFSQSGHTMTVAGDPDNQTNTYAAANVEMALSSLSIDGAPIPPAAARAIVTMTNVKSSTQMQADGLRTYTQAMTTDNLTYDMAFNDPESDDNAIFKGALEGVSSDGTFSLPDDINTADINAMLEAGFAFDGAFKYTAGMSDISGNDGEDIFAMASTSAGGDFQVSMNADSVVYDVNQTQSAITVTTAELPFPVSIDMAKAGIRFMMPVAASDDPQDFEMSFQLGDFTMSDMIWSMFDPAGALPRDPATIALDLIGKATVLVNFLDPEVAENLENGDTPPGELNALTIRELMVSMVGAKLTGTGNFTFDNSDMESFDGMPAPTGVVDMTLSGANGLLDKLIEMGFVSNQDAMGARMMMGMLAVAGDGPDTLESRVEITEDGQILANGQRIK